MNSLSLEPQTGYNGRIMNTIDIAKVCHEVNKAYCEALGDNSQVSWEEAPAWQVDSAINGVCYHLQTKETFPDDSHNEWCKEKYDNGWVFGITKDADKKTHPCLVPFDDLPNDQKAKDFIFHAIIKVLNGA